MLSPQNDPMTLAPVTPIEQRLSGMAAAIRQLIPAAEVRLFGSRARGEAAPDSDVDLLITSLISGALWPSPSSRLIWCCTRGVRPHAELSSPGPWCRKHSATECCSMVTSEAERLLRIVRRQPPQATVFSDVMRAQFSMSPDFPHASQPWPHSNPSFG